MNQFDYVVGAGSAGCVIAARLSENAQNRVLLLEAGPADGPDTMAVPPAWPSLIGTEADWGGCGRGRLCRGAAGSARPEQPRRGVRGHPYYP